MKNDVRIVFQQSDGTWPVGDKLLNDREIEKLVGLMPSCGWILVGRPGVISVNQENLLDCLVEKLSDSTLRQIANEAELTEESQQDILNTLRQVADRRQESDRTGI